MNEASTGGLDYADQRYFAGTMGGRFLTVDPYPPPDGMSNPGEWNRYSFVAGDPVNSVDPDGLVVIKINGAFNSNPDWIQADSEFSQAVADTFVGQTVVNWTWPGWGVTFFLDYAGIEMAGGQLASFINNYQFQPGEQLNIVAFSDGGNVVKSASYFINRPIDNLVTLGTPQNWDIPDINSRMVKNYCNVYSLADPVQFLGSSPRQIFNAIDNSYDSALAQWYAWQAFLDGNFAQFFKYQALSAKYAAESSFWVLSTRVDARAKNNIARTSESHFGLHTRKVWTEIARPCGLIR